MVFVTAKSFSEALILASTQFVFRFFLLNSYQNQSTCHNVARMGRNFEDYRGFKLTIRCAYNFTTQCIYLLNKYDFRK